MTIYFGLNLAYLVGLNDFSAVDVLVIAVRFVIRVGAIPSSSRSTLAATA